MKPTVDQVLDAYKAKLEQYRRVARRIEVEIEALDPANPFGLHVRKLIQNGSPHAGILSGETLLYAVAHDASDETASLAVSLALRRATQLDQQTTMPTPDSSAAPAPAKPFKIIRLDVTGVGAMYADAGVRIEQINGNGDTWTWPPMYRVWTGDSHFVDFPASMCVAYYSNT